MDKKIPLKWDLQEVSVALNKDGMQLIELEEFKNLIKDKLISILTKFIYTIKNNSCGQKNIPI